MQKLFQLVLVALLVVLFAGTAQASLEYYGIDTSLQENGATSHTVTFRFSDDIKTLNYRIGADATNLTVEGMIPADCRFEGVGLSRSIACSLSKTTRKDLILKFDTQGSVSKVSGNFVFDESYSVPLHANTSFIVVRLPAKSVLSENTANESYLPADGKTLTDGRRIMVYWDREDLKPGDTFNARISFSSPTTQVIVQSNPFSLIPIIVVITIIIGGASIIYIRNHPRTEHLMAVLNEDEKKVVDILTAHGGKALQKQIVREGDFSKAKVTRLVKSLKGRNVIVIEPVSGRENRVLLKKMKAG